MVARAALKSGTLAVTIKSHFHFEFELLGEDTLNGFVLVDLVTNWDVCDFKYASYMMSPPY